MKIALIGCGRQASKHVPGLRQCPEVEIVLADKDPTVARALGEREGLGWVESVEDVLADPEVTAVDLCVPTPFHAPLIRRSLTAGKDFFSEKPLCETAAEARELNALATKLRRIGMVGYVYRQAPVFQKVRSILCGAADTGTSPVIGKIAVALLRIGGRGSTARWKHRRGEGGGAIAEMLVHMIDLAVWIFGPVSRGELLIEKVLRPERLIGGTMERVDAEDFVLARFETQAGIPIVVQADLVTPAFTQMLEVQGDNGTLIASIQREMPQFVFTLRAAHGYPSGRTELGCASVDLFATQMAAFVASLRARLPQHNATLADSVRVMEAVDMLRVASRR